MPPRKKKRKAKTPKTTQKQSQRQSVVVNIGSTKSTKSKPRKSSGSGGLPPPSHMHNLAPTFVTAPPVDYTPLLAMIQHHSKPIVQQEPMPVQNAVTPLSSANVETNNQAVQQKAGQAAIRRAGRTAANFQRRTSESSRFESSDTDEDLARQVQARFDTQDEKEFNEKVEARREAQYQQRVQVAERIESVAVAQAAEQVEEQLIKKGFSAGKQAAEEEARQKQLKQEQQRLEKERKLEERYQMLREERAKKAVDISEKVSKIPKEVITEVQRDEFRKQTNLAGLNLADLSQSAQKRLRKHRTPSRAEEN